MMGHLDTGLRSTNPQLNSWVQRSDWAITRVLSLCHVHPLRSSSMPATSLQQMVLAIRSPSGAVPMASWSPKRQGKRSHTQWVGATEAHCSSNIRRMTSNDQQKARQTGSNCIRHKKYWGSAPKSTDASCGSTKRADHITILSFFCKRLQKTLVQPDRALSM